MSVPNHRFVIDKLFATGLYDLTTEHGQGTFVDACVSTLHGLDERWGHLKKNSVQTSIHDHGEDSALYLSDVDGQSTAVDFIASAGTPNAKPAWQVDQPRYSAKDWIDPTEHLGGSAPPPQAPVYPSYEELGGDSGGILFTRTLEYDYRRAGRNGLDADCGAWQQRTNYDFLTRKVPTMAESIAKHRKEWCDTLGIDVP